MKSVPKDFDACQEKEKSVPIKIDLLLIRTLYLDPILFWRINQLAEEKEAHLGRS